MTMMVTKAQHNEVVEALNRTIKLHDLETVFVDPERHKVMLHRGLNFWTYGDDVKVHLVDIDPVVVVHIQSRISEDNKIQLFSWSTYHWKQELEFLQTLSNILGPDRCHILD